MRWYVEPFRASPETSNDICPQSPKNRNDPLREILIELGSAPMHASDELDAARSGEIALTLTNTREVETGMCSSTDD